MFLPLGPPFLFIAKGGTFERWIKDHCGKIIRALGLHFIEIFIIFFNSHINTRFKEGVAFILEALLSLLEDLMEELYISN